MYSEYIHGRRSRRRTGENHGNELVGEFELVHTKMMAPPIIALIKHLGPGEVRYRTRIRERNLRNPNCTATEQRASARCLP